MRKILPPPVFSPENNVHSLYRLVRRQFIFHKLGTLETLKSLSEALVSGVVSTQILNCELSSDKDFSYFCYSQPVSVFVSPKSVLKMQCL